MKHYRFTAEVVIDAETERDAEKIFNKEQLCVWEIEEVQDD